MSHSQSSVVFLNEMGSQLEIERDPTSHFVTLNCEAKYQSVKTIVCCCSKHGKLQDNPCLLLHNLCGSWPQTFVVFVKLLVSE